MSRARLEAILNALAAQHWEFVSSDGHKSADPFRLDEGGEMVWTMRRANGRVVELAFWAITDFGNTSKDLRDILHCTVGAAPEIKLNFSKISSDQWRPELQQFVWSIQDFCKRSDGDGR